MTETEIKSFATLNVRDEIVKSLREDGIVKPTTIQEKTIPLVHAGNDIIGISRTGSGKTASFGIPLLEKVQQGKGVQGLVLAPTRELANQISNQLIKWSKNINLNIAVVFGGVGIAPQEEEIARSEIVVGTPGRTLDLLSRGSLDISKLKVFVLDEADKMVEMGFIEDIERIISAAPNDRQILLFGATISNEIDYLKKKYMSNVKVAEAELHVKKDLLKQYYYNVQMNEKFSLLAHLIKNEDIGRAIIFCSKRSTVELVNKNLRNNGIKSEMIHGKMTQNKRLTVIERFNDGKTDYLVASSVAARGLDIKDVTHVFNYDLASDPQEYIHRVGRTARAGAEGKAITLLSHQDHSALYGILDRYDIDVVELTAGKFEKLRFETIPRDNSRGQGRYNRSPHSRDRPHHHGRSEMHSRRSSEHKKDYGNNSSSRSNSNPGGKKRYYKNDNN